MRLSSLLTFILWALVLFGFVSVLKVSIDNYRGLSCPNLIILPVCYVVTIAYALMLGSLMINHHGCKHYFFCIGWGVAFAIAFLASLAEAFGSGRVCPTSSGGLRAVSVDGIPLCYISLFILVCILILFIIGPYRNICDD